MVIPIQELTGFKSIGNNKRKKQILLVHTSRNVEDYLSSLRYRRNGSNKKLPNYIIKRNGEILQVLPPEGYGNYMEKDYQNKRTIIISMENLGWLKKNPLQNSHINWIGNIYKEKVYERKWRGYFFWEPYTDNQMKSLIPLILELCDKFNIPTTTIGHNVKVDGVDKFDGVATYSNYDSDKTELSPAFDFEQLITQIDNE